MITGNILIFSGDGHGKSPAALGKAIEAACNGKKVVIIQFLKEKTLDENAFIKRLEPEIKFFRFEKSEDNFNLLSEEVLCTGECNLLILDEVLGLLDNGIITIEELKSVLQAKSDDTAIIMTGITVNDEICNLADEVSKIETIR